MKQLKPLIITLFAIPIVGLFSPLGNEHTIGIDAIQMAKTPPVSQIQPPHTVLLADLNTVPIPVASPSCASYWPLIAQYDWPTHTMYAIMQAESGCNPYAVSSTADYGLMQIHLGLQLYGPQIYNPAFNMSVAYQKYITQGLGAWSTYDNGDYLGYL